MAGLLLGAVLLATQATLATIAGTVRDSETRAPLPGAVVALTDIGVSALTSADGRYALPHVPAGPHHVAVRCLGYAPRSLHALVPRGGELEINVSLEPEPVQLSTVQVRARVTVRGTESADSAVRHDRVLSIAAMRNHPLLTEPDALVALSGGDVVVRPESPSGVHIRGGASDQTAYLIDGIPVLSPYHVAGVASAWNPDALSRLVLSSSVPSPSHPHALSGSIEAATRAPGERFRAQGSVSTTQTRLTLDGPLGDSGAGYLLSGRSGLHDVLAPRGESSYLKSTSRDWFAKLESPLLGGRARVLMYGNGNRAGASAVSEDSVSQRGRRNAFDWHGRSLGGEWSRAQANQSFSVRAWSADGEVSSDWLAAPGGIELTGTRRDLGALATFEHRARGSTVAALRMEALRTRYQIEPDSAGGPRLDLDARPPVTTLTLQHDRPLGAQVQIQVGAALALADREAYSSPRAGLKWTPTEQLELSCACARTQQFAQSLRNPESVVSNIFPVDVFVAADGARVPVANSDQASAAIIVRPWAGVRIGVQGYERVAREVLLVAPRDGEPFSTGGFTRGEARARGVSADLAISSARWGLVASYGWQRVRYEYGDSSYVPDHGAAHHLDGGVIVFPSATSSVRLGAVAVLGRRTTVVPGGFDWSACNLLNRGCEFSDSPHYGNEPLGAVALPGYLSVDVGLRMHWHLHLWGREARLEAFASASNILGRMNILTYVRPAGEDRLIGIELRPLGVLVAGVDWQF
ncbi:MAG: TonB-dependent receptor [Candidatus Eisenbacteria bacterium]|uniref:TonB-dependent receptor n=1 Tax=Eiseniibacteriota bacterium TaxID=2212470 RepID=A0A849SJE7_UNCEI|nr:TonB-dependent receptor [Candidatus Eisenbacteria bacterium]